MRKHKKKIKITHNPAIQRNLGIHMHMYEWFKKNNCFVRYKAVTIHGTETVRLVVTTI